MIRLPKLCGPLALACAKELGGRYSMQSIHVQEFQEDQYRIEATDGRILAILRGQSNESTPYKQMLTVANDLWEYLVPAETWTEWFKRVKKGETLGLAAEKIDPKDREEGEAVEGTHNIVLTDGEMMQSLCPEDQRFPNCESVLPTQPALLSICFQPALMIRLLTIVERIQELAGMENREVHLLFWGEGKPVGICFRSNTGEMFDGIIMPLSGVYPPPTVDADPSPEEQEYRRLAAEQAATAQEPVPAEEPALAEPQTAPPAEEPTPAAPEEHSPTPEMNGQVETVQAPKTKKPKKPWFRKKGGNHE